MKKNIPIATNDSIPSIEFLENAFKAFEKCSEKEYKKIMDHYVACFNKFPIMPLQLWGGNIRDISFYRIITEDKLIHSKPIPIDRNKLSAFSCPPPERCTMQRFNLEGFPLLYTADLPHTAIEETGVEKKQCFYLSEWKLKKDARFAYISLFYGKSVEDDFYKNLRQGMESKLEEMFEMYTPDKRRALKFWFEKLTDLSIQEKSSPLTAALGHYYLEEGSKKFDPPVGMIIYPSIKKKYKGYNFVFHPKLIEENILQCVNVKKLKLNNHSKTESSISLEEIGIIEGDMVKWINFSYRIEGATFYYKGQEQNHFNQSELGNAIFVGIEDEKKTTLKEILANELENKIKTDIETLYQTTGRNIRKIYNCTLPAKSPFIFGDVKMDSLKVSIEYIFNEINS